MLPHIGFSLQSQYDQPLTQVIALLKNAGFSAVSPVWSPELDLAELAACVREHSMMIQSLHAPHRGIPLLWEPDFPSSTEIQQNILRCIDDCARFHIPILVLHGWQGLNYTFPTHPLNFRYFDDMIPYARQKGVSIAFENLEGEEYLHALLTRYRDQPHVGFCWDTGHDHCYPHKLNFMDAFGDRLIMTHLNDNFGLRSPNGIPDGKDDLHFLPYDGNIDWDNTIYRLQQAPRQAILNFEIKIRSHSKDLADMPYTQLSLESLIELAGDRARQIARQYAMLAENTKH